MNLRWKNVGTGTSEYGLTVLRFDEQTYKDDKENGVSIVNECLGGGL